MHEIINADINVALSSLKDQSIDISITSPPYWDQRDYGFELQIGNEDSYLEYIARLVANFRLMRDKMKPKGIFFLNIGDKYFSKYGKTPLTLIPFKLAYFMVRDGWILNDIIIWYKPNHMPSSVKNRFTNSYEPVFVFSKNRNNYFKDFTKTKPNYSNILSVNLQPTPYKHVAVYPEKLVADLLKMVKIPSKSVILDPFAGSGTTLKVVDDHNKAFKSHTWKGIMIECAPDYINIIMERVKCKDIDVKRIKNIKYNYDPIIDENEFSKYNRKVRNSIAKDLSLINIAEDRKELHQFITLLLSEKIKDEYKDKLIFIGIEKFRVDDIYDISLLNTMDWVIRNLVIVKKDNKWFPLFMIVHDNKKYKYPFNYKKLELKHKHEDLLNFRGRSFLGYEVNDNLSRKKRKGEIVEVMNTYRNGLPKYVLVKWHDSTVTREFVIQQQDKIQQNLLFRNYGKSLKIVERRYLIGLIKRNIQKEITRKSYFKLKKEYNGKFLDLERKNWGASPGARSSVEEESFSVQRLYDVQQDIVCDYLNLKLKEKGLSKKAFTDLFPPSYKHTVGHWLRKDFGGSLPLPDDWFKIKKHVNLSSSYTNYVCKTALKLQSVQKGEYKIPEDVIDERFLKHLPKLV